MASIDTIEAEEAKALDSQPLFRLARPVAIQSVYVAFEFAVSGLISEDWENEARGITKLLPKMWERTRYENAVSWLMPEIWRRCNFSGSYVTSLSKKDLQAAVDAVKLQIKINLVNQMLYASRFGNAEVELRADKIRLFPTQKIAEWEPVSWVQGIQSEFEMGEQGADMLNFKARQPPEIAKSLRAAMIPITRAHGFEDSMVVGDYSLDEYLLFWAGLQTIVGLKLIENVDSILDAKKGKKFNPRSLVTVIRGTDLRKKIVNRTSLPPKKVASIYSDLVYDGVEHESSIYLYPIVSLGSDFVILSPHMIGFNHVPRNLRQRLIIDKPSIYRRIKDKLSENSVLLLMSMLEGLGYVVKEGKQVRDTLGVTKTDIDILALKGQRLLVIQAKNLVPPDSYSENMRATEVASEAEHQMDKSLTYVKGNLPAVADYVNPRRNKDNRPIEVIPLIVSGVLLHFASGGPRYPTVDVGGFARAVERIELGHTVDDQSVSQAFRTVIGKLTLGSLKLEVGVGAYEAGYRSEFDFDSNEQLDWLFDVL